MGGRESVLAEGIEPHDLVVTHAGNVYVTDPGHKQVWLVSRTGEKRVVDTGIANPNGVILSPDQTLLYVADTDGQFVYSFRIAADGSLTDKEPFYHLHLLEGTPGSHADGMTVDTLGNLYVATELGVQVCDQAGEGRPGSSASRNARGWRTSRSVVRPSMSSTSPARTRSTSARCGRRARCRFSRRSSRRLRGCEAAESATGCYFGGLAGDGSGGGSLSDRLRGRHVCLSLVAPLRRTANPEKMVNLESSPEPEHGTLNLEP